MSQGLGKKVTYICQRLFNNNKLDSCNKYTAIISDPKKRDKIDIGDPNQFEIKTLTSAVKNYLR